MMDFKPLNPFHLNNKSPKKKQLNLTSYFAVDMFKKSLIKKSY